MERVERPVKAGLAYSWLEWEQEMHVKGAVDQNVFPSMKSLVESSVWEVWEERRKQMLEGDWWGDTCWGRAKHKEEEQKWGEADEAYEDELVRAEYQLRLKKKEQQRLREGAMASKWGG